MTGPVLGIDLGTTNSVVASIDAQGHIVVLRNPAGAETTPSAVYFEDSRQVVVGDEARHAIAADPSNGIMLVKRHMGTDFPLRMRGTEHTPESVSALILRQLVAAADSPERPRVVITVPAYFGLAEREATAQAGRIAELDVLELVDEPIAAAVHYGLTNAGNRSVLVYDLGGGTFDTTVLEITEGRVTALATDGHSSLGGADVDQRLLNLVLERLGRVLPTVDYDDLIDSDTKIGNLMVDIEAAKRDLSTRTSRDLVVRTATDRVTVTLRREDLEAVCADLFDTTIAIVERVVGAARVRGVSTFDEVVMVGGSSRIPLLSSRLEAIFGIRPRLMEPDLAVAKGAALRAHQVLGTSQLATAVRTPGAGQAGQVTPVAPRAVGILIDDSHDPAGERVFVEHLVHANTALPTRHTTTRFGTIVNNQQSVRIQVYEQSGQIPSPEVADNRRVLDGELTDLGSLPAGSVIEMTVVIAVDGRLTVVAREPRSGRALTLEAFVDGVVDTAEAERLTQTVGLIEVRG